MPRLDSTMADKPIVPFTRAPSLQPFPVRTRATKRFLRGIIGLGFVVTYIYGTDTPIIGHDSHIDGISTAILVINMKKMKLKVR